LRFLDRQVEGVRTDWVRVLHGVDADAVLIPVERFNVDSAKRLRAEMTPRMRQDLAAKSDGLCLFMRDPLADGGGGTCSTCAEVKDGVIPGSMGQVLFGLVPDGVASVTMELDGGGTIVGRVLDNFFAIASPGAGKYDTAPAAISATWRAADGEVINTIEAVHP
jgi:hypothetical protein